MKLRKPPERLILPVGLTIGPGKVIKISVLTKSDIRFAHHLTEREGWRHLESDLSRLLSFNPNECLVANYNGNRAGILFSTIYNRYSFLGCLIVEHEYRNKGIGKALMTQAIERLQSAGVMTIELDGVFPALSLYRRLRFRDKYLSLRMTRPPHQAQLCKPAQLSFNPDQIICYDTEKTGLDRGKILIRFLHEFKEHVYINGDDAINGYAILRSRAGDYVAIGLPEVNQAAVEILKENGFVDTEPSVRMYLGEPVEYESSVFAIISAEKG